MHCCQCACCICVLPESAVCVFSVFSCELLHTCMSLHGCMLLHILLNTWVRCDVWLMFGAVAYAQDLPCRWR